MRNVLCSIGITYEKFYRLLYITRKKYMNKFMKIYQKIHDDYGER